MEPMEPKEMSAESGMEYTDTSAGETSLWAECFSRVLDEMKKKNSRTLKFDDVDRLVSEKAAYLYQIGDGIYEYRPAMLIEKTHPED